MIFFFITETKIDKSFPNAQLLIPGLNLFRRDRTRNGGGFIFYINQDLPCKIISEFKFSNPVENPILEVNLSHSKILIIGLYKPPSLEIERYPNDLYNFVTF